MAHHGLSNKQQRIAVSRFKDGRASTPPDRNRSPAAETIRWKELGRVVTGNAMDFINSLQPTK
jgi:hypothetical protein